MSYHLQCIGLSPPWLKFISRYFILFDETVNGMVFLISLSDSLLLVYKNTTDFCALILYPKTLLNSFTSFNSFWWHL